MGAYENWQRANFPQRRYTLENALAWDEFNQRKEVKSTMVRIGRVVFDESNVSSVMRENGTGNPVKVTVYMKHGESHEFNKYAKEAWEYFKSRVSRTIAG